jgi:hypothetical protein
MKSLTNNDLQQFQGGGDIGCAVAVAAGVLAFVGLFALTAGASAVVLVTTVGGAILAPTGVGIGCFT